MQRLDEKKLPLSSFHICLNVLHELYWSEQSLDSALTEEMAAQAPE
jgi:hypothetical protein